MVRWPGVVKQGSLSDRMVLNLDYAETILDMAGIKIPTDMQGKSFVPVLKEKQKGVFRSLLSLL